VSQISEKLFFAMSASTTATTTGVHANAPSNAELLERLRQEGALVDALIESNFKSFMYGFDCSTFLKAAAAYKANGPRYQHPSDQPGSCFVEQKMLEILEKLIWEDAGDKTFSNVAGSALYQMGENADAAYRLYLAEQARAKAQKEEEEADAQADAEDEKAFARAKALAAAAKAQAEAAPAKAKADAAPAKAKADAAPAKADAKAVPAKAKAKADPAKAKAKAAPAKAEAEADPAKAKAKSKSSAKKRKDSPGAAQPKSVKRIKALSLSEAQQIEQPRTILASMIESNAKSSSPSSSAGASSSNNSSSGAADAAKPKDDDDDKTAKKKRKEHWITPKEFVFPYLGKDMEMPEGYRFYPMSNEFWTSFQKKIAEFCEKAYTARSDYPSWMRTKTFRGCGSEPAYIRRKHVVMWMEKGQTRYGKVADIKSPRTYLDVVDAITGLKVRVRARKAIRIVKTASTQTEIDEQGRDPRPSNASKKAARITKIDFAQNAITDK